MLLREYWSFILYTMQTMTSSVNQNYTVSKMQSNGSSDVFRRHVYPIDIKRGLAVLKVSIGF